MSQIDRLTSYIKLSGYLSYDAVKFRAEQINPKWRGESWRRELRNRKDIEAVGVDRNKKPSGHNPIIGFEAVEVIKPLLSHTSPIQSDLGLWWDKVAYNY